MKKFFRVIILAALLLGLMLPVFDHYLVENKSTEISVAQESKTRNIQELFKLARESFYQANYQSAENYYLEIIKLAPFNLESRRNLAALYTDNNQLAAKSEILVKTAILSADQNDYLALAVNLYNLHKYRSSNYILQNLVSAELRQPENLFQRYYYLVKNSLKLGQFNLAEEYLMKITNLKSNQAQVYLLSAELNQAQANYLQAFNDYQSSYQKNRTQTFLFKDMALMLEKAGQEIKAYNYWQKTLAYGWFEELAYQKINFYQQKHPELKPEPASQTEPDQINPFTLTADWQKIEELDTVENNKKLRIGLQEKNQHLLFQYADSFAIIKAGKIIFRGQAKKNYLLQLESNRLMIRSSTQKIYLGAADAEYEFNSTSNLPSFYVFNIKYGQGYFWQGSADRQYRGEMIIHGTAQDFTLINQVGLASYLISVVPSEIYASWPVEALKAQTIAARSYTLSNLDRHSKAGYDLCSSVHCAAYNGVGSENNKTTQAVLATAEEAAYFDNKIIEAVFSSNSGGFTERSDQIWTADLFYLRGANQMKTDDYEFPLPPGKLYNWIFLSAPSYSKDYGQNNYRWQVTIPASVISYQSELGKITRVEVLARAQGGTITSLRLVGEKGKKEYNSSRIRRVLGGLKSSRFTFSSSYDENGFLEELYIYGSGWGHNLGMDQSAAAGMAADNWNYRDIIEHFYPGVIIKDYN